jgi:hypothetical protein
VPDGGEGSQTQGRETAGLSAYRRTLAAVDKLRVVMNHTELLCFWGRRGNHAKEDHDGRGEVH